ncbi:hypothetical protein [Pseudogulbenkiania subflava]|uniref:hypothetical protein n=1 Tax=Pseudogulbenkiania subflava TaxID=451637 RepID=UPI00117B711D|nr:hypothetical protein [Pseudogulbenkiania subflava]
MAVIAFMLICARTASANELVCGKIIPKEYEESYDHNVELREAIVNVAGLDYDKASIFSISLGTSRKKAIKNVSVR